MNELVVAAIGAGSTAAIASGAWLSWALRQYRQIDTAAESQTPPIRKYAVLERLGSGADLEFLRSLPGYTPKMEKRFLRERRRVFRSYLQELATDFRRLHLAARQLAAAAPEEHADLAPLLMKQQWMFWRSLMAVELRLAVQWTGVPAVNLRNLSATCESLLGIVSASDRAAF